MKEYLTAKEIAQFTYLTERAVQIAAKKGNYCHRHRMSKGGGKEYYVPALPENIRTKISNGRSGQ